MNCPHCGAEHKPADGRFCTSCGLSVQGVTLPKKDEEPEAVRCRICGMKVKLPICPSCGARIPEFEEIEK